MTRSRSAVVWRDPRFRLYWTGQTVSEVGDRVSELALPLAAVTVLNARAVQVGALVAAIWLPNLLALFVGTWLDRLRSKQRMLISANLVQAAAIAAVPLAYAVDRLSMPVLYVAAVVGGLGGVLYHTAYAPFFVQLVPREQYLEANSLLSTTRSASFIAGPPLAGALVSILTAPIALVVDACSFLLSSLLISRVDIDEPARDAAHQETYRRRLRLGVRYLRYHPFLRATLACSTTLNFFSLVVQAVLIIYAVRSLGLSAGSIGLALGVGASGGLVGAAIASRVRTPDRHRLHHCRRRGAVQPALRLPPARRGRTTGLPSRRHRRGRVRLRPRHHAVRHHDEQPPGRGHPRQHAVPCLWRLRHGQLRHPTPRGHPGRLGPPSASGSPRRSSSHPSPVASQSPG